MKNLLRIISLAAIIASFFAAEKSTTINCGPATYTFRATISSVRDGNWNDPGTWGGVVPGTSDNITIQHSVIIDDTATVAGLDVKGVLSFRQGYPALLQLSGNLIVTGQLIINNPNPTIIQTIRFIGINESNYQGGGMDVLASDVGLWVMGAGQLALQGSKKTSWTRAIGDVAPSATQISLQDATGWRTGDEIAIVPTAEGDYTGFEERIIIAIAGNTITLNSPLTRAHPKVNDRWTAEVMNLTRNVRIEGTAAGRSHTFIRSSRAQSIEYVQYRHLGPRKQQGGDAATEAVLGRYALHIHHSIDGSRGTIVRGCAARDIGNNVYVPHVSHGIRMLDNIAYNILGSGFWWDEGFAESSHDVAWIGNIVAKCNFVSRSINVFAGQGDITLSARAFMLNHGDDDTAINNVAVGVYGDPHDGGGFKWEAVNNDNLEGVWHFRNNLSHNIDAAGLISWQNVQMNHLVTGYTAYNCREGIFHGAYANSYRYDSVVTFNAPVVVHAASSNSSRIRFENSRLDNIFIEGSPLGGALPILFRNCIFDKLTDQVSSPAHNADIIQSTGQIVHAGGSGEIIRIQPAEGQPTQKAGSSTINIATFAPGVWSNGKGLKGEYYNNTSLSGAPAFTRTDNYLGFGEWGNGVHYLINRNSFSARWTGFFQAQFTEQYTITAGGPGTVRLWVNNVLYTGPINLVAGKFYPIKIEYIKNNSQRGGIELRWRSPSLDKFSPGGEFIPQSQLCIVPPVPLPLRDPIPRDPSVIYSKFIVQTVVAAGAFTVKSPPGKYEYRLIDVVGRQLEKGTLQGGTNVIDVSRYTSAVYVLQINAEHWKIIKPK